MDWIERIFGLSPDGGNGMTELLIVVVLLLIIVLAVLLKRGRLGLRRSSR